MIWCFSSEKQASLDHHVLTELLVGPREKRQLLGYPSCLTPFQAATGAQYRSGTSFAPLGCASSSLWTCPPGPKAGDLSRRLHCSRPPNECCRGCSCLLLLFTTTLCWLTSLTCLRICLLVTCAVEVLVAKRAPAFFFCAKLF